MRWPRGKYNGKRIDGFYVSLQLHLLYWQWRPLFQRNWGEPYFIWLCFTLRGAKSFAFGEDRR